MLRIALPALLTVLSVACSGSDRGNAAARSSDGSDSPAASGSRSTATQPTSFTGTLRGGAVAIGGETTGWRLEGDGQTGGIELDVSRIQRRARSLDGKRVTIRGRMTTRSWTERGQTQVLVAETIEEAAPPRR